MDSKSREVHFQAEFLQDLRYWIKTDRHSALRSIDLVEDVIRNPFTGLGKPEPLKYLGPHVLSRRLSQEHRVVYVVRDIIIKTGGRSAAS
jgi:toxin YoeB